MTCQCNLEKLKLCNLEDTRLRKLRAVVGLKNGPEGSIILSVNHDPSKLTSSSYPLGGTNQQRIWPCLIILKRSENHVKDAIQIHL